MIAQIVQREVALSEQRVAGATVEAKIGLVQNHMLQVRMGIMDKTHPKRCGFFQHLLPDGLAGHDLDVKADFGELAVKNQTGWYRKIRFRYG